MREDQFVVLFRKIEKVEFRMNVDIRNCLSIFFM